MGVVGIVLIILLSFLLCNDKRNVNWRTVISSFLLFIFSALFVFVFPPGVKLIAWAASIANTVVMEGQHGAEFLFGKLFTDNGFIFAISLVANIIYLGALFAVLYYLRIMPILNDIIAFALCKLLGISKAESLNSVMTMFLGSSETYLAVKPLLANINRSQTFTILVSSMASASGSVMGGYVAMGMRADYILSALLLTIPASIFISKLMYPQTETVTEIDIHEVQKNSQYHGVLDAIGVGASHGCSLGVALSIMVLSFVSIIALINGVLHHVGLWLHMTSTLSLSSILGHILSPVAYLLGVPARDITAAGAVIAEKTITNEFVGFMHLKQMMPYLQEKTQVIAIFTLCGFANLGTLGICIGCIKALFPEKAKVFCELGFKALFAAILVNLLTGAVAGVSFSIHKTLQHPPAKYSSVQGNASEHASSHSGAVTHHLVSKHGGAHVHAGHH